MKGKINKEDKPNLIAAKSYILNCVLTPIRLTINQKDQIKTTSNAAIIPRIFLFWNKSIFVIFSKILSSRIGKTKYKAFRRSNKTRKFRKYLYYKYVHF